MRPMVRRVARALRAGPPLRAELEQVVAKLQRAAGQARRTHKPNAYQRLLDPSLLALT